MYLFVECIYLLRVDFAMLENLIKCKDRVEYLLSTQPETRDCDKTLWLMYLFTFHNLKSIDRASIPSLRLTEVLLASETPTPESIRRIRQKYQESGLYVGTKRKQKLEESDKVRQWAREIVYDDPF